MVTVVCVRVVTVIECAIGGLHKCAKFGCSGDTFGGCWLLLILMMFHCCFYLIHSNASSCTLLHILRIFAISIYFALVPSHALGA